MYNAHFIYMGNQPLKLSIKRFYIQPELFSFSPYSFIQLTVKLLSKRKLSDLITNLQSLSITNQETKLCCIT